MNRIGDERYKLVDFGSETLKEAELGKCTKNNCEAHDKTLMVLKEFEDIDIEAFYPYRSYMFDTCMYQTLENVYFSKRDLTHGIMSNSMTHDCVLFYIGFLQNVIFHEHLILNSINDVINIPLQMVYEKNDFDTARQSVLYMYSNLIDFDNLSDGRFEYYNKLKEAGFIKDVLKIIHEPDPIIRLKRLYSKKRTIIETAKIMYPIMEKFINNTEKDLLGDLMVGETETAVVLPGMRFVIVGGTDDGVKIVQCCHNRIFYTDYHNSDVGKMIKYDDFSKISFLMDWDYVFCYVEAISGNGKNVRFFAYTDNEFKRFYYDQNAYESFNDSYDINHVKLITILNQQSVLHEIDICSDASLKEIIVDEVHLNAHELVKINNDIYITNYITINKSVECRNINNEYDKVYVTSYEPIKVTRKLIAGLCIHDCMKKKFFYDSHLNKYYAYPTDSNREIIAEIEEGEIITEITELEVNKDHPLFILGDTCQTIPLLDDNKLNAKIISIPLYYSTESLEGFDSKILEFYKNL